MPQTYYTRDKKLNWIKGTTYGTAPSAVYVALYNGSPTPTGAGGSEVTTTIRVAGRVAATFGSITQATGQNSMANTGLVDYGNSAGNATVDYFALFDAASSGNMLYFAALTTPRSVTTGGATSFAIGALVCQET